MEEAQITENKPQDESMYQTPEYPSMVDTDDIIYEMGKQVVDNLNKEKLLKIALKKLQMINGVTSDKDTMIENLQIHNQQLKDELDKNHDELKVLKESTGKHEEMMKELETLRGSNEKYVKIAEELETLKKSSGDIQKTTKELEDLRKSNRMYEKNNRKLDAELVAIRNKISSL